MGAGARGARGAWWCECAGGGAGSRGAPPGRVAPRKGGAQVLLHLNMQRNSGGDGLKGRAAVGGVQFWLVEVQSPCKVQVCTSDNKRSERGHASPSLADRCT